MTENIDINSISGRMTLIINELNESQRQIALKAGVTPQTITDVIKAKVEYPSTKLAIGLYEAFRISIKWFLTGEGEMFDKSWQSLDEDLANDDLLSVISTQVEQPNNSVPMTAQQEQEFEQMKKDMAEIKKQLAALITQKTK